MSSSDSTSASSSSQVGGSSLGNIAAGAQLDNAQVMPIGLTSSSGNNITVTSASPMEVAAASKAVQTALASQDDLTKSLMAFTASETSRANDLAAASTGTGPLKSLISGVGVVVVVIIGLIVWAFTSKKGG